MTNPRIVVWFSCGAASAVAAKLALKAGAATIAYCETGAERSTEERQLDAVSTYHVRGVRRAAVAIRRGCCVRLGAVANR